MWGVKTVRYDHGHTWGVAIQIQWKLILTFLAIVITLIILAGVL